MITSENFKISVIIMKLQVISFFRKFFHDIQYLPFFML
jgi:hypothetical protein